MGVAEEDPEPQQAVPQRTTPSASFSDADFHPSSNGGIETTNPDGPLMSGDEGAMPGATEAKQRRRSAKQLKRKMGSDDSGGECECEPARKRPVLEMLPKESDNGASGCGPVRKRLASQEMSKELEGSASERGPVRKRPTSREMSKELDDSTSERVPVQKRSASQEMSKESDEGDSGEGGRLSHSAEAS